MCNRRERESFLCYSLSEKESVNFHMVLLLLYSTTVVYIYGAFIYNVSWFQHLFIMAHHDKNNAPIRTAFHNFEYYF